MGKLTIVGTITAILGLATTADAQYRQYYGNPETTKYYRPYYADQVKARRQYELDRQHQTRYDRQMQRRSSDPYFNRPYWDSPYYYESYTLQQDRQFVQNFRYWNGRYYGVRRLDPRYQRPQIIIPPQRFQRQPQWRWRDGRWRKYR